MSGDTVIVESSGQGFDSAPDSKAETGKLSLDSADDDFNQSQTKKWRLSSSFNDVAANTVNTCTRGGLN